MPSYVQIAKPDHTQNAWDSAMHNLITTWEIRTSTGFVTGAVCRLKTALIGSSMLKTTYRMIETPAIIQDHEGEHANNSVNISVKCANEQEGK